MSLCIANCYLDYLILHFIVYIFNLFCHLPSGFHFLVDRWICLLKYKHRTRRKYRRISIENEIIVTLVSREGAKTVRPKDFKYS